MLGPMAARRSEGLVPKCICILPMVLAAMRARVPRQPAWMAAMARFLGSTRRMGTQSAVWMARRRPGWLVMLASPLQGSVGASSKTWITSEWNCFSVTRERSGAPTAIWKRRRFSRTFSRVSQSVKPRLRTFSLARGLMPAGRVLKAWISQGSLEKAGTWRILAPLWVRVVQALAGGMSLRLLRTTGFFGDAFVGAMRVQV